MRIPAAALGAALWLIGPIGVGAAFAQDDDEYSRSGWYASLQTLYAFANSDVKGASADDAWGASGRIGYRLARYLAAEFQFESAIAMDLRSAGTRLAHVSSFVPTLNARAYPLGGRWQPYGLVGLGPGIFLSDGKAGQGNSWEAGFAGRTGIGVDLYGSETWAFNLEGSYVFPTGPVDGFQYGVVSWGFLWRF